MMNKMKKIVALMLAAVMALSMIACGESEEAEAPAVEEAATAEEAAAEDGQVTIKIAWWGGDARHAYTQELLDKYTELNPHVTFEATPSGWDGYFDKLSTQAASGSLPDIVQMDYLYISTFAQNGTLADLTPYIEDGTIDTTNVDDAIVNTGIIGEKNAGLPIGTSIFAVTYNPATLEAAGQEVPSDDWTWEDYIALNKAVSEHTGEESATIAAIGPFGDMNPFNYFVRQHGEVLFNADGTGLGFEDDAITAEYFQMWKDMSDADIAPDPDETAQMATLGREALPVVTGEAGTTIEWNNFANVVSSTNDTLKLALMPGATTEEPALWLKPSMFLSVAETSTVKEECAKFINWFINSEEANDIIAGERGVPISSAVREYMVGTGTMTQTQIEMFEYVDKATPYAGECPAADPIGIAEVNETFVNAGNSVLYGQATPEEAAATFREQATEILERNNAK